MLMGYEEEVRTLVTQLNADPQSFKGVVHAIVPKANPTWGSEDSDNEDSPADSYPPGKHGEHVCVIWEMYNECEW